MHYYIIIFLRRKVPGQTGAWTHDLRQHRLHAALNTNVLTLLARSPFVHDANVWLVSSSGLSSSEYQIIKIIIDNSMTHLKL
jgi:hypothetical protein